MREKTPIIKQESTVLIDSRDSTTYATVVIGNQRWMAENLRYNALGSWLNPNNPSIAYGRLYDWATVMNGVSTSSLEPSGVQGICPSGWHLPSDVEWSVLEIALGMSSSDSITMGQRGTHCTAMKSTTGWANNGNGTNSSGFNAFSAGFFLSGTFLNLGDGSTSFWSSTEKTATLGLYRSLGNGATVHRYYYSKTAGLSCRCIEN